MFRERGRGVGRTEGAVLTKLEDSGSREGVGRIGALREASERAEGV